MKTLYLDMDGVVADFDAYAFAVAGFPPSGGMYSNTQWAEIASNHRLYRDLPKTVYADQLVEACRSYCIEHHMQLIFLTAVPKGNDMHWSFYDKVNWARQHYPDIPVHFGPFSQDKQVHCLSGDILIDDRMSNITEWAAVGGNAIHHVDIDTTLAALNQLN